MLDQTDGGHTVGQHQLVAERVVQGLSNFGTEHHFEWIVGERSALGDLQRLFAAVLIMFEVAAGGAHNPVTAVRITERNGNCPFHSLVIGIVLVAIPADVVGGIADAKH
ncbi:hypothetical protein D3C81_578920 [compost metagenome]